MTQANNISCGCSVDFLHRQTQHFPLNTFFSLQTFRLYQNASDFLAGIVEFPLALVQAPYRLMTNQAYSLPQRNNQIQAAINLSRYRNVNPDVI